MYHSKVMENPFNDPKEYTEKVRNLTNLCRFVLNHWGEGAMRYMIIPKHLLSEDSVEFLCSVFFEEFCEFYSGPGRAFGRAPYVANENSRWLTLAHETGLDV